MTTQTPPPNPPAVQRVVSYLRHVTQIIVTHHLMGMIPSSLAGPITDLLREIKQRIEILAASLQDGTWRPRRLPAPRTAAPGPSPLLGKPRPPGKFPHNANWLAAFLRPLEAPPLRGDLSILQQDPDIIALLEKAPPTLARRIRSLYWMLGMKPPSILANPRKRRTPAPKPQPQPKPKPATPPPPSEAELALAAARLKWAKPRGSLSNDLRRKAWPHRSRLPKNSA